MKTKIQERHENLAKDTFSVYSSAERRKIEEEAKERYERKIKNIKFLYEVEIDRLKNELKGFKNPKTDGVGWKGKSGITVMRTEQDEYLIVEHRKSKTTGEVTEKNVVVPKINVVVLRKIINRLTKDGEMSTKYREIVPELKAHYGLNVGTEAFNGGLNRQKIYFPYYYYPMKILEFFKEIHYSGRGKVTVLRGDL